MTHAPRALLFDLDGTLLDTAPDMIGALNELRIEQGAFVLPEAQVRPLVSHGAARLVRFGFPDADPSRFASLQARFLDLYRARVGRDSRLFEGMQQVLDALVERGVRAGIVTNKPQWLTEPLLECLGLRQRFVSVVSGDSVSERKPHPMPLLHAAAQAGVEPVDCLYVGDAERDIQAAHAAHMRALVATYGYLGDGEDWRAWHADGHIDRPIDLIGWLRQP